MTDHREGWFAAEDPTAAIESGDAAEPRDWPTLALEAGVVDSREAYYDKLHAVTTAATKRAVERRERADDRQLVHALQAMDDCRSSANELAERLAEWSGSLEEDAGTGVEHARALLEREDVGAHRRRLARRIVDLREDADALEATIEAEAPQVAPNLAALAGPVLAARLIALAGGLESLAKKPSGTVQVLGAEEALFAHLDGHAPSPKHGVIYTHEAVRGTRPADRGSAARALAGKLAIAARVDHYSGEYRPTIEADLAERLERIRSRGDT